MNNTWDVPRTRLFLSRFTYPKHYALKELPHAEKAWTNEAEEPFRTGQSVAVRVPFSRLAIVAGRWTGQRTDVDEALLEAAAAEELPEIETSDIALWGRPEPRTAPEFTAQSAFSWTPYIHDEPR